MAGWGLAGLWMSLILVVAASISLAAGGIWLANRLDSRPRGDGDRSALSAFLTTVALVYGALLGFTVVVAWEQFSSAEANVNSESSTLATMYRQTVGMPNPQQAQMRELLRTYAAAIQAEWDHPEGGNTSEAARDAIDQMYQRLGQQDAAIEPNAVNGQFLNQLTVLTSERDIRLLDAKPRLPGLLWAGLMFGGVVLIGLLGFARLESRRGHLFLSGAVAVLLGLLLFLVFWLDHPFGRQLGVTPAPIEQAQKVFDGVDRGVR